MTTRQPAALWIAYELEIGTFVPNVLQNEIVLRQNAAAELRRQHARITELEAQLAQRFTAADMATAAAQGFRDGVASLSLPAVGQEPVAVVALHMLVAAGHITQEKADEAVSLAGRFAAPQPAVAAGWMPIETAPKDGSEILICKAVNADGEPMGKSFGLFVHRAAWWGEEGWIVYNSLICENQAFFEPTHWMPIPPAPSTEG